MAVNRVLGRKPKQDAEPASPKYSLQPLKKMIYSYISIYNKSDSYVDTAYDL